MSFLIDTDILIDLSKQVKAVIEWFNKAFENELDLAVCPINVAEFYAGIPVKERNKWDKYFESIECFLITKKISRQAGIWRYDFSKKGVNLHIPDCLIAATALAHNATLVTKNTKDYPMSIKLLSI